MIDRTRKLMGDLSGLLLVIPLILLVGLLPPDTSLREIREAGILKACVPTAYPPLVTGDPGRPGIDVEILHAVADRIGVRLVLNEKAAMGRDFNPRNWRLNRASCEVLAGGVVDSSLTRSFLETSLSYGETGWASVAPSAPENIQERAVGVLIVISGLDRIGLARYLRDIQARVRIFPQSAALAEALAAGRIDVGVTEAFLAAYLARENDWQVALLPPELERHRLVFGLWKGDVTLKRAIDRAFRDLEAEGELEAIISKYVQMPADSAPS